MSIIYINPFQFGLAYDADAQDYINRVIAADVAAGNTSGLEVGVQDAINDFFVGCKADGIWSAIKACCILAGARTLDGALVPLVGGAPTNFNFVSGDYDRETGLLGDGSTKYLNSNRNNNADPQDSNHNAFAVSSVGTGAFMGVVDTIANGANTIGTTPTNRFFRNRALTADSIPTTASGFCGVSRSSSASFLVRTGGANTLITRTSETPQSSNISINRADSFYGTHRFSFYSIGESLDLAALDTRVSNLITAIGTAIP